MYEFSDCRIIQSGTMSVQTSFLHFRCIFLHSDTLTTPKITFQWVTCYYPTVLFAENIKNHLQSGLHKWWNPAIQDWRIWTQFGEYGEHGKDGKQQPTQNFLFINMIHYEPDQMISDVPWMFSDVP